MSTRRLVPPLRFLMILGIASSAFASAGCGEDNPSGLAGTIELAEKKFSPPPDPRSAARTKASPKTTKR